MGNNSEDALIGEIVPDVDTLTEPPKIGKFYVVSCIMMDHGHYAPVLGLPHEDSEFEFGQFMHYHFDYRFAHPRLIQAMMFQFGHYDNLSYAVVHEKRTRGEIFKRPMKCLRNAPLPPPFMDIFHKLYEHFKGKKMTGMVCPHKGTCLSSVPQDGKSVVCPAHGLAWNIKTGKNIRRT